MNDHDVLSALSWLSYRPWFRRLWVLQEVGVASKVVLWGKNAAVPWGLVVLAMFWQEWRWREYEKDALKCRSAPQSERAPPHLWRSLTELKTDHRLDILSLLHATRSFSSIDPRDKVFALLGLGEETHLVNQLGQGQRPDYTKSKAQVLRDFTYSHISKQKSLDILSAALFPHSLRNATIPSWVPTYLGKWPQGSQIAYPKPSYHAAGSTSVLLSDSIDPASLLLQGIRINKIKSISPETCTGEGRSFEPYHTAMKRHWSLLKGRESYPTGEDLLDVFLEVLCCCSWDRATFRPNPHIKDFVACWQSFDPELDNFLPRQREKLLLSSGGKSFDFYAVVGRTLHYRWFCVTDNGYMGMCPYGSEPGDLVVVLYGGSVPFVLRQWPDEKYKLIGVKGILRPRYEMIGECYIHGQMDDDIIEKQQFYHIPNEMFDIR